METQTSHRNLALDSLRGFSTIIIVVYHTSFVSGYTVAHADSIGAYIDRLNIGVAIFFVLSGFLIFRPFAHSLIHGSPLPKTRNYYLKRAAVDFIILDNQIHSGGAWQHTWPSLRLFSPALMSSLPGKLMPKAKDGQLQSVRVGFKGGQLAALEIADSLGQRSVLTFNQWQDNAPMKAERFRFQPPAGADVIRP